MAQYDLYGGSIELYFKDAGGQAYNLTNLFFNATTGHNFDPKNVHFIERISVQVSLLRFTHIEISFAPTIDKAVTMLGKKYIGLGVSDKAALTGAVGTAEEDPELASQSLSKIGFNQVIARLHYGGRSSNYFKCVLLVPEIDVGSDGIRVTLKGTGILFPKSKSSVGKVQAGKSRLQIIRELLSKNDEQPDLNVEIMVNGDDAVAQKGLGEIENITPVGSKLEEATRLAKKSGCVILDKGSTSSGGQTIYEIISREYMRKRSSRAPTFVLWDQINPNKGIYPILDMKTSLVNYAAGLSLGLNTQGVSSKDRQRTPKEEAITSEKAKGATVAGDGTATGPSSDQDSKQMKKSMVDRGKEFGHSIIDSATELARMMTEKAIQYELTVPGVVDLIPGQVVNVRVKGVEFLTGAYDLWDVTHEIGSDGVTTVMTLGRTFGLVSAIDAGVEGIQQGVTSVVSGPNAKTSSSEGVN